MNKYNTEEGKELEDELLYTFNEKFKEYAYKDKISFENLIKIVKDYGYNPSRQEIMDLKGEIGEKTDKIYFFVIMKRVVNEMFSKNHQKILKQAFKIIDTDNSGTITKNELEKSLLKYGHISIDEMDEIFNILDTNNDNHISYEEFCNYIKFREF